MTLALVASADPAPPGDVPVNLASVRERLKRNRAAMTGFFSPERGDIFLALDALAVSGHNGLLLGPPGTGKSLMVETAFSAFQGIYRRELLTRQTTEADALAYLDVPVFAREGRYTYRIDGKLTEAHFAFVDEAFKATGGMLNALLTWLNEKLVRGGHRSPLISCVGASNEFPEDDTTAALEDRFLVRFWVEPLTPAARLAFLRSRADNARPPVLERISLAELASVQAAVQATPIEDDVSVALSSIVTALGGIGIVVSERRAGWCLEYLRAIAWLDGAASAEPDHLDALAHVLWRRPEDRPGVLAALAAVDRGGIGEVRRIAEAALAVFHAAANGADFDRVALDHAAKLTAAAKRIEAHYAGKIPPRHIPRLVGYVKDLLAAKKGCDVAASRI